MPGLKAGHLANPGPAGAGWTTAPASSSEMPLRRMARNTASATSSTELLPRPVGLARLLMVSPCRRGATAPSLQNVVSTRSCPTFWLQALKSSGVRHTVLPNSTSVLCKLCGSSYGSPAAAKAA